VKNQFSNLDMDVQSILDLCQRSINELENQEESLENKAKYYSPERKSVEEQRTNELFNTLKFENDLLRKKLDTLEVYTKTVQKEKKNEFSFQETEDRLKETNGQLEKRITNLMKELELKDIQIKSQEQMISRRNKEIDEFKSKSYYSYHTTENDYKDSINKERMNTFSNYNYTQPQAIRNQTIDSNKNSKNHLDDASHLGTKSMLDDVNGSRRYKNTNYEMQTTENDQTDKRELSQEVKGIRSKIRKNK